MIKNGKRHRIAFVIVFLISVLYFFRYVQINSAYHKLQTGFDEIYYIGEEIPLEENYIDISLQARGYSICANALEIVDTVEYVTDMGLLVDERQASLPERLALVSATIRRTEGIDECLPVLLFEMYGNDFYTIVDFELFNQINVETVQASLGVALPKASEQTVIIPFRLDRDNFNFYTWNHLDNYPLSMRLTYGPARIIIYLTEK